MLCVKSSFFADFTANNPKVGMTIDDYIVLADIPKILLESEEELPGLRWRNQSPSPCRGQEVRTHRLVEQCKYCICCFAPVRVSLVQNYKSFLVPLKPSEIGTN